MDRRRALGAEVLGTFLLVLGGCGSAVFAANFPDAVDNSVGIGFLGVSLAFGLTVVCGAYALAHVSGAHFNPAVTVGLWVGKRFPAKDVLPYVVAQVIGAVLACLALWAMLEGRPGFETTDNWLAANGFGETGSPGGYAFGAALIAEVVLTAVFLLVILGVTSGRAPVGFAPLAIGLTLALIHLISIPITNTSVNPARSTGPALFVGGEWLEQLWFFWVFPILGGAIGAAIHRFVVGDKAEEVDITGDL
jgi:aquaporin Z